MQNNKNIHNNGRFTHSLKLASAPLRRLNRCPSCIRDNWATNGIDSPKTVWQFNKNEILSYRL